MLIHEWQVPITVHFDHGTSKQDLVEALELVSCLFLFNIKAICLSVTTEYLPFDLLQSILCGQIAFYLSSINNN